MADESIMTNNKLNQIYKYKIDNLPEVLLAEHVIEQVFEEQEVVALE
jgi:hypothetical protein